MINQLKTIMRKNQVIILGSSGLNDYQIDTTKSHRIKLKQRIKKGIWLSKEIPSFILIVILCWQDSIIGVLGQGTFGKVVEVYHTITNQRYAIKIIKSIQKYTDASKIEIKILNELKSKDPQNY